MFAPLLCSPYKYGHSAEVSVSKDGKITPQKWYTLGRNSQEMAYVM